MSTLSGKTTLPFSFLHLSNWGQLLRVDPILEGFRPQGKQTVSHKNDPL